MCLCLRGPRVDRRAELDSPTLLDATCIRGDAVRSGRIDDAVATLEGILAGLPKRRMHSEQGTGATVRAVMTTFGSNVDGKLRQALPGELGCPADAAFQPVFVDAHSRSMARQFR